MAKRTDTKANELESKYTTQLYYGKLIITHYRKSGMEQLSKSIQKHLQTLPAADHARVRTMWIFYKDGTEYIDAVLDKQTGEWRQPRGSNDNG